MDYCVEQLRLADFLNARCAVNVAGAFGPVWDGGYRANFSDVHLDSRYTLRLEECGPGDGEFPLKHYVSRMNEVDREMPMILEHLNTDEDYIKYMGYLKKELNGLA